MTKDNLTLSMPRLKAVLGQEHVYISAADTQRHFNSEIVIGAFILSLISNAARIAMEEIAKAAGKAAWSKLSSVFHKLETSEFSDSESQTKAVGTADEALRSLGSELSEATARDFVEASRLNMEKSLMANHFPVAKAKRISTEFSTILKERISHA